MLVNLRRHLLTNFQSFTLPTFSHTQCELRASVSERCLFVDGNLANLTLQRGKPFYNHTSNANYEKFLSEASMRSIKGQTRPYWKHLMLPPILEAPDAAAHIGFGFIRCFFPPSFTVIWTYIQSPAFSKLNFVFSVRNI